MFRPLRSRQLSDRVSDRPSNRGRKYRLTLRKSGEAQRHLTGEIRDGNTGGRNIPDVVGNQAKTLFSDGKPLTVGSVLCDAVRTRKHDTRTGRKGRSPSLLHCACPLSSQDQRCFGSWVSPRQNGVV